MPARIDFPITTRWPARHPERIALDSRNTPNGVKVSIMLEECGLAYEPHCIDIMQGDSRTPAFLSLNPNAFETATRNGSWIRCQPASLRNTRNRPERNTAISRFNDRQFGGAQIGNWTLH